MRQSLRVLGLVTWACIWAGNSQGETFKVREGKIDFHSKTNAGFGVDGTADLAAGRMKASENPDSLEIDELEILLPPKTFKTGMDLRDEHLYERVFKDSSGAMKDIRVSSGKFQCAGKAPTWECEAPMATEIRGISKPVPFHLKIEKKAEGFEVNGTAIVTTTQFDVEKIAYMMVELNPDVDVVIRNLKIEKEAVK